MLQLSQRYRYPVPQAEGLDSLGGSNPAEVYLESWYLLCTHHIQRDEKRYLGVLGPTKQQLA